MPFLKGFCVLFLRSHEGGISGGGMVDLRALLGIAGLMDQGETGIAELKAAQRYDFDALLAYATCHMIVWACVAAPSCVCISL